MEEILGVVASLPDTNPLCDILVIHRPRPPIVVIFENAGRQDVDFREFEFIL